MRKLIIVAVLVLVTILFGAPYYTGKVAEDETLKLVAQINQSSSEYGSTEVLSYERAIRSTNAKYKYTPPAAMDSFSKKFGDIIYACQSKHGVTGIDFTCALEGESAYSKFVNEKLNGKDPLSVYGSISAFGGLITTISFKEINDLEVEGATLNFPSALASISTDINASEFILTATSDDFEMSGNGETLSVGKLSVEADFSKIADALFSGDMLVELDYFNMSGPRGDTSLKSMSASSSLEQKSDTLSSELLFSVEQVVSSSMPFDSIADVDFKLDFEGLDTQAFIEYQAFSQKVQQEATDSSNNITMLIPILEKMLKKDLNVGSKIEAKLDGKPNNIALNIKLLEALNVEQIPLFMLDPDGFLTKLDASLKASFDKALVDSQPLSAAFIGRSPLAAASEHDYTLDLTLDDGINLNGKAMTFSELRSLFLSSLPFSN